MTSTKNENPADIAGLAAEVMDLWQEHLAACATDTGARSELMRLLEPQRKLFADWAALMQNGAHAAGTGKQTGKQTPPATEARASAAQPASDDSALRLAQLAHRTAQLEKHIKDFERRIASLESGSAASAKTGRHPKSRKSGVH